MFTDCRSKRLIILAHCVLNQNAKLDRCAHYPGAINGVLEAILASGAGMIQLPCPELLHLGLARQADETLSHSVAAEDTRIAHRMAERAGIAICREAAANLVYQVEAYKQHGFSILGLVGINGSPTCGVETTWFDDQEQPGPGVLVRAICDALEQKGLSLTMRGIKAYEPEKAFATVKDLLVASNR